MDEREEYIRGYIFVAAILAFLVSLIYSWSELNYLLRGQVVSATITDVRQVTVRNRRGPPSTFVRVEYTFSESDGTRRNEYDTESEDWTPPAGGTIDVQYLPGLPGRSRLDGHAAWWAPVIVGCTLAFLIYKCVAFWIDFSRYERERKAKEEDLA